MTHSDASAILAIAQHSPLSKKMPYIFAGMIKLYDGTQLPYSTQIVSSSLGSADSNDVLHRGNIKSPLTLSTITIKRACEVLYHQVWSLGLDISMKKNLNVDEMMVEDVLREWIDSSLNVTLRSELLTKIFHHEFDFSNRHEPNIEIDNDTSHVDSYFRVWRTLFKVIYHPNMKYFIIPDVKSIIVDRMYLKMQDHLKYHTKHPDETLPPFKYQDQLQEIMFMGHKQEYLLRKLIEYVTSSKHLHNTHLLAEKVKFGLEQGSIFGSTFDKVDDSNMFLQHSDKPIAFDCLLSRLSFVKYMEIENCLSDNDLLTIGRSCHQLGGLTLTGCGISNLGIHNLAFPHSTCPYLPITSDQINKSPNSFCTCTNENVRSNLSPSLLELNIKGLLNVDYVGVLIALRAFKSLNRIDCRNESLCVAIESVSRLQEHVEWNSSAIKNLECGLKQTLLYSIFKHKNDMVLLYILSKSVPRVEKLTYHFNDFVNMIRYQRPRKSSSDVSREIDLSKLWTTFRNLSTLYLTNIIGSELIVILKSIGGQLSDLSISNISLWSYFNTLYPTQRYVRSPNNSLFNEDVRINLFELAMTAPNLKRLSLEMCHFIFKEINTQNGQELSCTGRIKKEEAGRNGSKNFELMAKLKELHFKGVNSNSSGAVKEFLCRCSSLEELILLTKQYTTGNYNLRFNARDEYEFCSIINENSLSDILKRNQMKCLKVFVASTVEPCPSGCTLQLTEKSIFALLDSCSSLERIGNLDRWNIQNLDSVLSAIKSQYRWKTCPVYFCSKVETPITI